MTWTVSDIPSLRDQTIIVTGANSGIGLATARELAGAGATVVLACRNLDKAAIAQADIESGRPPGTVEVLRLDLADQGQIATAADEALDRFPRIDRLINNAGVLAVPFTRTVDGFEMVFGTNHLGHYAFTGRILPALLATPGSRIVTVASMSQRIARMRWDDLDGERSYSKARAYSQSKLANLLHALELQRRLVAVHAATISLAVHPGFAATDIASNMLARTPRLERLFLTGGERLIPSAAAAWPSLRAATAPDAYGGQYYGPSGFGGITGAPVAGSPGRRALDEQAQRRLWTISAERTGVDYPLADATVGD